MGCEERLAENLYGAPYWSRDIYKDWWETRYPQQEIDYGGKLFFSENSTLTSSFTPIKKILEDRIFSLRVDHGYTKLLDTLHRQESLLLNCSQGEITATVRDINNYLQEEEQTILNWCLRMLKETSVNENINVNSNTQLKPIDFSHITETLVELEKDMRKNKSKSAVAEMIHALAKGTSQNDLAGPQGELAAAFNMLFAKARKNGLNISIQELKEQIPDIFTGKSGVKIDIKIPYFEEAIPISVKNYAKVRKTSTKNLFSDDSFQDLTIQSSTGLVGFLKYLETNLDERLKWDDTQLENFNIYLVNLFYFRFFPRTKEAATDAIDNIRETINQLLTLYAPAFLMTGTDSKHTFSFYNNIMQQLKKGNAAIFFYLSGHGLIPMSKIIEILHSEEENVKAKLELHTTNVESNIHAVDVVNLNTREYIVSKTLTNVTKGVFRGGPNAMTVITDRYNLYTGGGTVNRGTSLSTKYDPIGTKIQLKIQMSALKQYMPI